MGAAIQVRNLDPEVQVTLKTVAARKGLSFSEYLRRTLTEVAERERLRERWERRVAEHTEETAQLRDAESRAWKPLGVDRETILDVIREGREER